MATAEHAASQDKKTGGKTGPRADPPKHVRSASRPAATSTVKYATLKTPQEGRTPNGGVTASACSDILPIITLGITPAEDQQLLREKCR
jgi:hypothetical protein